MFMAWVVTKEKVLCILATNFTPPFCKVKFSLPHQRKESRKSYPTVKIFNFKRCKQDFSQLETEVFYRLCDKNRMQKIPYHAHLCFICDILDLVFMSKYGLFTPPLCSQLILLPLLTQLIFFSYPTNIFSSVPTTAINTECSLIDPNHKRFGLK